LLRPGRGEQNLVVADDDKALPRVVGWIVAVQVINLLDAAIVQPLAPQILPALQTPLSYAGVLSSAYASAAVLSALLNLLLGDVVSRPRSVRIAMSLLVLGTGASALAPNELLFIAARCVAGLGGGAATSLLSATLLDVVDERERPRALAAVMTSTTLASTLGVPMAVVLAAQSQWQMPFVVLSLSGAVVWLALSNAVLPPGARRGPARLELRPTVASALTIVAMQGAAFAVLAPNLSVIATANHGFTANDLALLHLGFGTLALAASRAAGRIVNAHNAWHVTGVFTAVAVAALGAVAWGDHAGSTLAVTGGLLAVAAVTGGRGVAVAVQVTAVPSPSERVSFSSAQFLSNQGAQAVAAWCSSQLLRQDEAGHMIGFGWLAGTAATLALTLWAALAVLGRWRHTERRASTQTASPRP
jgi:DHA1 family chloramphenicol resistance protein-like MFS transporter